MAVDRIFDTEKLRAEGRDIKTYAQNMYDELQNVNREMDSSRSCFDSDAGEKLRQNFRTSANKFAEFKKVMDDYGKYLEELADQKEEIERKLADVGGSIPKL